ncbi:hypothetical protein [Microbacterium sp.]|uniref:hypothetical protein n=1 Tax=Microbacterium sp. TaxID=51671 RepID=UPI0039E70BFD
MTIVAALVRVPEAAARRSGPAAAAQDLNSEPNGPAVLAPIAPTPVAVGLGAEAAR